MLECLAGFYGASESHGFGLGCGGGSAPDIYNFMHEVCRLPSCCAWDTSPEGVMARSQCSSVVKSVWWLCRSLVCTALPRRGGMNVMR